MRRYFTALAAIVLFAMLYAVLPGCRKELLPATHFPDTSVVTGADTAGYADGTGSAARFNRPFGLTIDRSGNLYVADQGNDLIRMIAPGAVVTTLAGAVGVQGSANGADSLASFNSPFGVATDTLGNIYVADAGNNVIRLINAAGQVSTFAGTGTTGSADGTDTASFNSPMGVATDKAGNVYVADYENHLIRKISPAGVVSTIGGKAGVPGSADGVDTAARFDLPEALAVDAAGNIYVADNGNNLIRKITPAGQVTTLAGSGKVGSANGTGQQASFNSPFGITVDGTGNVYVADAGNNLIRKITPTGTVTTLAGSGAKGATNASGTAASFNTPAGIAIDASGNIYVSDENNNLIREITPSGTVSAVALRYPKFLSKRKNRIVNFRVKKIL